MPWRAEVAARLRELLGESPQPPVALVVARRGPRRCRALDAPNGPLAGARSFFLDDLRARGGGAPWRPEDRGTPLTPGSLGTVVLWLAETSPAPAMRQAALAEARRVLRAGGTLVVVDHNRPRTCWRRVRNAVWCAARGIDPVRRPAYPVAREVMAAGFDDVALRLGCAEKIQLVRGRRRDSLGARRAP
jgi:SAM-dependent methyltransferase